MSTEKPTRRDALFGVRGMRFPFAMRLQHIPWWRLKYRWWRYRDGTKRAILRWGRLGVERLAERWGNGVRFPKPIEGKLLQFRRDGRSLGHDVVDVTSSRGGFSMGTISWSNQWNRPRFKAHPEAVFDQQCVAEIYAAMKELK